MKIIVPDYLLSNLFIVNSQRYFSWYENVGHPVFFSVDILLLGVGWQGDVWYAGAEQTVVSKPIPAVSTGHFDFFAVETVQQSVPAPLRVMRKLSDKSQRVNPEGLDACLGQYFSWARFHRANSVEVVLDGHSAELSHNADYLKFGILII